MGYRETAGKYNINHAVITRWERVCLENGENALLEEQREKGCKEGSPKKGRPPKLEKQVKKDLIAEIQQLRMKNEYLKKRINTKQQRKKYNKSLI